MGAAEEDGGQTVSIAVDDREEERRDVTGMVAVAEVVMVMVKEAGVQNCFVWY